MTSESLFTKTRNRSLHSLHVTLSERLERGAAAERLVSGQERVELHPGILDAKRAERVG